MADRREAQSSSRTEREDKEASSADCDNGGQTSCSTRSIPGAREPALRPGPEPVGRATAPHSVPQNVSRWELGGFFFWCCFCKASSSDYGHVLVLKAAVYLEVVKTSYGLFFNLVKQYLEEQEPSTLSSPFRHFLKAAPSEDEVSEGSGRCSRAARFLHDSHAELHHAGCFWPPPVEWAAWQVLRMRQVDSGPRQVWSRCCLPTPSRDSLHLQLLFLIPPKRYTRTCERNKRQTRMGRFAAEWRGLRAPRPGVCPG